MRCKFTKGDGSICSANSVRGSEFCFSHDPNHRQAKLEAVTKGGLARKTYLSIDQPIKIESVEDIKNVLAATIEGVWIGKIPANQPANAIGFLCRCYLDVYEKIEIESRMIALEEKVDKLVNKTN